MAESDGAKVDESGDHDARKRGGRLSEILTSLAMDESRDRVSVADIFQAMGDRAFGALILIFALPNVVPTPPGTSALTGAPLVFLSAQLMLGQVPWLPQIIAKRSMSRADFASIVIRLAPWLARGERMLRPRLSFFIYPPAEYVIGLLCLVLAVILTLPVPLGNILPAIAICLFSFGILERDGVCVLLGTVMFGVSLTVVAGVLYALVKGFILLLTATVF
ncbi:MULTISPECIES: exopolysaccharide biosynthesis protein [Alphaproteobacteria]|uniref:ABC transporter permease n=2 Tax=Alphaproteobacteria TaxID=28211 RepID=A0A512HJ66_9HYPH|nr:MULTISPECIES: exopolysaccharide biosynthesis protein [Alphaproteobacteria]GEO85475.1 ABC transporter permease [Ciceribacter naphthalenivorans]GLR21503.1 ABC transporter permease [Ciceribacter naphthalenivorans]GLT04359.1 ABC transporter permease [Sphingomonas psychrolutea]